MIHRSIGSWSHGIIDYAMVIFLIIGPRLIGFSGRQATFCYILAAVHLALTLLTRFPLGVVKVVGFPLHGVVEFLAAIVILTLPWVAAFARGVLSRNFFVSVGLLLFFVWMLTDYRGLRGNAPPTSSSTTTS
jgi:hypothetical protein